MEVKYWDREGNVIEGGVLVWAKMLSDQRYRIVALDADGPESDMVSTIWSGISSANIRVTDRPVDTFETAVLVDGSIIIARRTSTEEEALATHAEYCMERLHREPRPEDGHIETVARRENGDDQ